MKTYAKVNGAHVAAETTEQCAIRTVAAMLRDDPNVINAQELIGRQITVIGVFAGYEYSDDNARTEYTMTITEAIAKDAENLLSAELANLRA